MASGTSTRSVGRPKRKRRQNHGSAWHWKQTDAWYYTLPGSKRRIPLYDDEGKRIKGAENKKQAALALSRIRIAGDGDVASVAPSAPDNWIVAKVCSDYLQYCERGVASGKLSRSHLDAARWALNDLCTYCGALEVRELKKGHVKNWLESHKTWRSAATLRGVISIILAAFNRAQEDFGVANPLKGFKKPRAEPRLQSFSQADEDQLLAATDEPFRNFLFAAIHTGLRPYSELARIKAEHVEETPRGMMWRVYASKTKKTRKIPIRAEVAALTKKLLAAAPAGSGKPLFRNPDGNQWHKTTGVTRFIRLRAKLGWESDPVRSKYSSYTCRHTFAHRMLSGYWNNGAGCSIETLAELIGDTPKVAFDHYGREWGQHYAEPLWAAIGSGESTPERARLPKGKKAR